MGMGRGKRGMGTDGVGGTSFDDFFCIPDH